MWQPQYLPGYETGEVGPVFADRIDAFDWILKHGHTIHAEPLYGWAVVFVEAIK